LKPPAF
jgi:hypothetical protein